MKFSNVLLLASTVAVAAAATVYTGDTFDGDPVITELDVKDLAVGSHRFWFRSTENGIGEYYQVPVAIEKGSMEGPVLFLQSSIHGDELAGTKVIQQVFEDLYAKCPKAPPPSNGMSKTKKKKEAGAMTPNGGDRFRTRRQRLLRSKCKKALAGTLVGIIGSNPTGQRAHSRTARYTTDGLTATNLNREMPGSNTSSDAGSRYAYSLWTDLYASNPDVFLDLHTQSRGTVYPYFIYADRRNDVVDQLVQVMPADIVKDDPGEPGTVETEMVSVGVPAMTVELGAPKVWDPDMTKRGVQSIFNVMYELGMMEGDIDMLGIETYYANDLTSVRADRGGYTDILVSLLDDVEEGQLIARQLNAFGDEIAVYTAPFSGRVLSVGTDPIRELGALLVRLVRQLESEDM